MNSKKTQAIKAFNSGRSCAQTVLMAFADDYNFDENLAYQISSGFGGGMGGLQKTCGAVTGAFMVIGIHNCEKYSNKDLQKENNRAMIQEFHQKFLLQHGTTDCIDLLQCNTNTPEGQEFAKENNLKQNVCEKCVANSIELVESLLKK